MFLSIKSFSASLSSRIRLELSTFFAVFSAATREAVSGVSVASTLGRFGNGGVNDSLDDVELLRRAVKSIFTPRVRDMGDAREEDKDESSSYESLFSSAAAVGATISSWLQAAGSWYC